MSLPFHDQSDGQNTADDLYLTGIKRREPKTWSRSCQAKLCRLWPPLCVALSRWRSGLFRFDPEVLELQTGIMALALGLYLLGSPDQWGHRPSNFSLMLLRLWPAPVWAGLFIVVGGAQIAALGRTWMLARWACAMSGFCLWSFVAILLALDGLPGPSVSVFPVIALSEAWVYLRLRAHGDVPSTEPNESDETPSRRT